VVATDNFFTDVDLDGLCTLLGPSHGDGICFIVNDYKKYEGRKVVFDSDRASVMERIDEDLNEGRGCTIACNTKKQADEMYKELCQTVPKHQLRLYTSKSGELPKDIDSDWEGRAVIYSPTITTGLDFNPKAAQNVYLLLNTTSTICPATAIQMCTRNRNIDTVVVYTHNMKHPKPRSAAAMQWSNRQVATHIQQQLQNNELDVASGGYVYHDNIYSSLYCKFVAHEVTRSVQA
jgi:hypothetical protein